MGRVISMQGDVYKGKLEVGEPSQRRKRVVRKRASRMVRVK